MYFYSAPPVSGMHCVCCQHFHFMADRCNINVLRKSSNRWIVNRVFNLLPAQTRRVPCGLHHWMNSEIYQNVY